MFQPSARFLAERLYDIREPLAYVITSYNVIQVRFCTHLVNRLHEIICTGLCSGVLSDDPIPAFVWHGSHRVIKPLPLLTT